MMAELTNGNHTPETLLVTDPGVDDALAVLIAAAAVARLSGIATFGNGPAEETSGNLRGITDFINAHLTHSPTDEAVESFKGADRPLGAQEAWYPEFPGKNVYFIHGPNACEGLFTDAPPIRNPSGIIYERLGGKDIKADVISLGAVTELAHMLKHKTFGPRVGSITIMGGTIHEPGNVAPHREANFRLDPKALSFIIKTANERGIPITIVTLDLTQQKYFEFTPERCAWLVDELQAHGSYAIAALIDVLAGPRSTYHTFYTGETSSTEIIYPYGERRFDGPILHDVTAVLVYTNPELFEFLEIDVAVSADGDIGRTADWMTKTGRVRIPIAVKEQKYDTCWNLVRDYLLEFRDGPLIY